MDVRICKLKSLFYALGLLSLGVLEPALLAAQEKDSAIIPAKKEELKTIIVDSYYPYTYVNKDNATDGFSIDLSKAVTQVMGLGLNVQVDTWAQARSALEDGEINFLPMMAYSKERDKTFDFSVPHTIAYDSFFTRVDSVRINSISDLAGKKIIVMKNDQAHDYLISTIKVEPESLILVDALPEALKLLAEGKGDTALMPKLVGLFIIKDLNLTGLIKSPIVIEDYYRPFSFAVIEGNQLLLERLSQGLSIVKNSGQYDRIYEKWFGAIDPKGLSPKEALKYFVGGVSVFFVVGFTLFLWSLTLKRQVVRRTKDLQESEERYRGVVEDTPVLICRFLPDGEITFVNKTYCKHFAKAPEELIGSNFLSSIPEIDRETVMANISALTVESPTQSHEHRVIVPDSDMQWQRWTNRALFDVQGRAVAYESIGEDITERKQAQDALKESEERFRAFMENAPFSASIKDRKGRYTYANASLLALLRLAMDEFKDKTVYDVFPKDDAKRMEAYDRKVIDSDSAIAIEHAMVLQDEEESWWNNIKFPIHMPTGETVFGSISINITDQKKNQEELKSSLKEKKILLQEIHHRVKNNIQIVASLSSMQARRTTDDNVKKALQAHQNRALAMAAVHELLYESESLSDIDLGKYIKRLSISLAEMYKSGSKIELKIETEEIRLGIDKAAPCGLAINELIANSFKHAFTDGQSGHIQIKAQSVNNEIEISIGDNGQGLPEDIEAKKSETMGHMLVSGLVENQLKGTWHMSSGKAGAKHTIRFKRTG